MLPPSAQELNARAALAQRLALPLVGVFCAGTVLTQIVGHASLAMTALCAAATVITLLLHRAMRQGTLAARAPDALLLTASIGLLALMLPSGGAESPMLLLAPLLPVIGALAGGARLCLLTSLFWLSTTALLAFALPAPSPEIGLASGWLALGLLAGTACGLQADRVISELRLQLHELTSIDAQTGLLNENGFADAASRELARAARHRSPLCLLAIKLDQAHLCRDSLSHERRAERLARLARDLKASLRAGQDLVSRHGERGFLVLLSDTADPAAAAVADRLQSVLRNGALRTQGKQQATLARIGYSVWEPLPRRQLSAQEVTEQLHLLIETADRAAS
jgi:diguanylate cyclase (GGDEF)-like protein